MNAAHLEATAYQQLSNYPHGIWPLGVHFTFMPIFPRIDGEEVVEG